MKVVSKVLFLLYQGLHVWGFILFFTETKESVASDLMIVILFIGTYQYFEFYSLLLVVVVVAPFVLIYMGVKSYLKRRRQAGIARRLEGRKYEAGSVSGDHSCKICMDEYIE